MGKDDDKTFVLYKNKKPEIIQDVITKRTKIQVVEDVEDNDDEEENDDTILPKSPATNAYTLIRKNIPASVTKSKFIDNENFLPNNTFNTSNHNNTLPLPTDEALVLTSSDESVMADANDFDAPLADPHGLAKIANQYEILANDKNTKMQKHDDGYSFLHQHSRVISENDQEQVVRHVKKHLRVIVPPQYRSSSENINNNDDEYANDSLIKKHHDYQPHNPKQSKNIYGKIHHIDCLPSDSKTSKSVLDSRLHHANKSIDRVIPDMIIQKLIRDEEYEEIYDLYKHGKLSYHDFNYQKNEIIKKIRQELIEKEE
jgi:hypothetical protein